MRNDVKRLDSMTLISYRIYRVLVGDPTCVGILAPPNLQGLVQCTILFLSAFSPWVHEVLEHIELVSAVSQLDNCLKFIKCVNLQEKELCPCAHTHRSCKSMHFCNHAVRTTCDQRFDICYLQICSLVHIQVQSTKILYQKFNFKKISCINFNYEFESLDSI